MVLEISFVITTMTNPYSCPRVWDDIDLLQRIVQTQLNWIDDFSSKIQSFT